MCICRDFSLISIIIIYIIYLPLSMATKAMHTCKYFEEHEEGQGEAKGT